MSIPSRNQNSARGMKGMLLSFNGSCPVLHGPNIKIDFFLAFLFSFLHAAEWGRKHVGCGAGANAAASPPPSRLLLRRAVLLWLLARRYIFALRSICTIIFLYLFSCDKCMVRFLLIVDASMREL